MSKSLKDKKAALDALNAQAKKKEKAKKPPKPETPLIDIDDLIAPPSPSPDMFTGLLGEVARIASYDTEVNPVSAALAFLSFIGANVGRDTFLLVNNTYHHPRLFTLHVGRSSRGGKGDSQQLTHRIRRSIEEREPDLLGKTHTGGLSSGEGLAAMLHDGYGETPPIKDKRLWVVEGELANVLKKVSREGNVLSSTLREMWDGSDIKPAVKTRPMGVTEPHIGLHACITPTELLKTMGGGEIDNGFANRFLMIWAENIGCIPFPTATDNSVIDKLADYCIDVITFALGNYPESTNNKEMYLSESARLFYGQVYRQYKMPLDNELVAGLLARRAPYTLRLAMLIALMDKSRIIEESHLRVAAAWVEYATQSVRFIFHSQRKTEKATEINKNAVKILEFLEDKPTGCSASDINNFCFKGHVDSAKIKEALHYLLTENPPLILSKKSTTGGRPKKLYELNNSAEKAEKGQKPEAQGIHGNLKPIISAEKRGKSPLANSAPPLFPHYSASKNDLKQGYNPHGAAFSAFSAFSAPILSEVEEKTAEISPDNSALL